ncbi:MAG: serine hydrolase domain-containing protein [Limisphaerales bacterium]
MKMLRLSFRRPDTAFAAVVALFAAVLAPTCPSRAGALPRGTPESQGVDSAGVLALVDALDRMEHVHSVMLLRHGHVIAEGWWTPYEASSNHELYSLSKSFTSTAVGFAVAEGRLSVDDEVLSFFPDEGPAAPEANLKAMRVRDLLTMSAGHQDETSSAPDRISAKSFLAHPVPHKPGTHFKYNTPATFMLSAIVQKRTGQTVLDYLKPRLFEPLGIETPVWNTNFQGISLGGYGLRVRTEDIARFGQFLLREGRWEGKQLLPASWIQQATTRQVSNGSNPKSDWDQGYGFQFWRCRNGAYRGDGAFGQYCVVFPEHDVVLAITSGLRDMQAVLNAVWDHLMPAFQPGRLPSNPGQQRRLEARLAFLSVPTPTGSSVPAGSGEFLGRTYSFPPDDSGLESFSLEADPAGAGGYLVERRAGGTSRIPWGHGEWRKGVGSFGNYVEEPLAASGAWTSDSTFEARICARETPYIAAVTLRFEGDEVTREVTMNVGFGGSRTVRQIGKAPAKAAR